MSDPRSLLERESRRFIQQDGAFERLVRRRDRKRRNQRIAAGFVGMAVFVAAIWLVTSGEPADRTLSPGTSGPTGSAEPTATVPTVSPPITTAPYYAPDVGSEMDYLIDVNTGEMTPLPEAIIGASLARPPSLGSRSRGTRPRPMVPCSPSSGPARRDTPDLCRRHHRRHRGCAR